MGNQAAAQILETITANYQACQFPIVCLSACTPPGIKEQAMRMLEETFNFGLQNAWCHLGAGLLPALKLTRPHYLSISLGSRAHILLTE